MTLHRATTIVELIARAADEAPDEVRLFEEQPDGYRPVTNSELWRDVQTAARALLAHGALPGHRVAIHGRPSYRWLVLDAATMLVPAVSVGLDPMANEESIAEVVRLASPSLVLTDDPLGRSSSSAERLPSSRAVSFEEVCGTSGSRGSGLPEHERARASLSPPVPFGVRPEGLATITFTSGTTGAPKGIPYTHTQLLDAVRSIHTVFGQRLRAPQRTLSWLPMHNQTGRTLSLAAFSIGAQQYFVSDPRSLPERMHSVAPTVLVAVPRLLDKTIESIERHLDGLPWPTRTFARAGLAIQTTRRTPAPLRRWADSRVTGAIRRAAFGPSLELVLCGSAALDPSVHRRALSLGVEVLTAYGMSECAQLIAVQRPGRSRPGTVGEPTPGMEVRVAADGEILVRHATVHSGYFRQPRRSDRDADGFLRTGDLGRFENGELVITGRIKDMIKTSTGLRIAPSRVERAYADVRGLDSIVVVGDGRPFLTALVAVSEELRERIERSGGDVAARVLEELRAREHRLAPQHRVRRVALLESPLSSERDELTSTMKLRRGVITTRYAELIATMYRDPSREREMSGGLPEWWRTFVLRRRSSGAPTQERA